MYPPAHRAPRAGRAGGEAVVVPAPAAAAPALGPGPRTRRRRRAYRGHAPLPRAGGPARRGGGGPAPPVPAPPAGRPRSRQRPPSGAAPPRPGRRPGRGIPLRQRRGGGVDHHLSHALVDLPVLAHDFHLGLYCTGHGAGRSLAMPIAWATPALLILIPRTMRAMSIRVASLQWVSDHMTHSNTSAYGPSGVTLTVPVLDGRVCVHLPRHAGVPDAPAGPPPPGLPGVLSGGRLLVPLRRPRVRRRRRVGPVVVPVTSGKPFVAALELFYPGILLATRAASLSISAVRYALARAVSSACSALGYAFMAASEAILASLASESLRSRTIVLRSSMFSTVSLAISSRRMACSGLSTIPDTPRPLYNSASPDRRCGARAWPSSNLNTYRQSRAPSNNV